MKESIGNAVIPVVRKNGADGEITVKWRTIDKSALSGRDFKGGEGELTFKHTEVRSVAHSIFSLANPVLCGANFLQKC